MGWDTWNSAQDAKAHRTMGDYLTAMFTLTKRDGTRQEVIASGMGHATSSMQSERVWYAALRVRDDATDYRLGFATPSDYVVALVVLVNGQWGKRVGYKAMDEIMGPYERCCPAAVLDRLTPLSDHRMTEFARKWRDECRSALVRGRAA